MKRALIPVVIAALALLAWSSSASAQTTYNQTNRVCLSYQCTKAEFIPAAELSYYIPSIHGTGSQSFPAPGTTAYAYWNGVEYTDFAGTYTFFAIKPSWCTVGSGWACYELKGTFNGGSQTVTERWECYRTCNESGNIFGSVVTP